MAGLLGTTVIHGNHGYFMIDGIIIGRAKNVTMNVEGSLDEFYEVGSAWLADHEVIQRKVNVSIERGAIDFKLLAYAVGVQAKLNVSEDEIVNFFDANQADKFNLIVDEEEGNILTVSSPGGTQNLTSPFVIDVVIAASKIISANQVETFFVTARDCKIIRHGISAPNSAYWTVNMDLTGKQIELGMEGITPMHIIK